MEWRGNPCWLWLIALAADLEARAARGGGYCTLEIKCLHGRSVFEISRQNPAKSKPIGLHHVENSRVLLSIILAAIEIASAASTTFAGDPPKTVLKTESFDRDPGWEGHNNHITPKKKFRRCTQDFGYSKTNFASKTPGEIGGQICRAQRARPGAAARIPPCTLDDKLSGFRGLRPDKDRKWRALLWLV